MRRQWGILRQHPSGMLLAIQLLGIVVYPFLGDAPLGRSVFGLIGIAALVVAVLTVARTPALTWVSVLLGGPVAVLTVLEAFAPQDSALVAVSAALHCAFYVYTAVALIRYMFDDAVVTTDEILATGATFTVVAWAFAHLFQLTQIVWPGSFTAAVDPQAARSWMELLFLSVTTLTSTGLSDIVPVAPQARSFVMLEQIAGMLYLALVVARITALTVNPARHRSESDGDPS